MILFLKQVGPFLLDRKQNLAGTPGIAVTLLIGISILLGIVTSCPQREPENLPKHAQV
jgi:hypothetical protein